MLTLKPRIEGDDAGHTLLFVQGWPDDSSLWDAQVARLSARYRCVRVDLPGYGDAERPRWGVTSDAIIDALARCAREVGRGTPITLVLHDWGCVWGHAMHNRNPTLVARVVGLDVAPHFAPGAKATAGIVAYQSWLAAAFFLGGSIGDRMTRAMAKRAGAPLPPERIHASMNYPYRNIWLDLISGRSRRNDAGYWPELPLLFVYGKDKPFGFHSKAWVEHVERTGGEVVALDGGHWVPKHPASTEILAGFLERTDARIPAASKP
jgi:pimeloyl-ACP methyl ester carboxylesterase